MIRLQCTYNYSLVIFSYIFSHITKFLQKWFFTRKIILFHDYVHYVLTVLSYNICFGAFLIVTHVSLSLLSEMSGKVLQQIQWSVPTFQLPWALSLPHAFTDLVCNTSHTFLSFLPLNHFLSSLSFYFNGMIWKEHNCPLGAGYSCEGQRLGEGADDLNQWLTMSLICSPEVLTISLAKGAFPC